MSTQAPSASSISESPESLFSQKKLHLCRFFNLSYLSNHVSDNTYRYELSKLYFISLKVLLEKILNLIVIQMRGTLEYEKRESINTPLNTRYLIAIRHESLLTMQV